MEIVHIVLDIVESLLFIGVIVTVLKNRKG